jgi:hypothetical protein
VGISRLSCFALISEVLCYLETISFWMVAKCQVPDAWWQFQMTICHPQCKLRFPHLLSQFGMNSFDSSSCS